MPRWFIVTMVAIVLFTIAMFVVAISAPVEGGCYIGKGGHEWCQEGRDDWDWPWS